MSDQMHHYSESQWSSPYNPAVRHIARQSASVGYDKSYTSSDSGMNFAIAKRFAFNQPVNVNIEGRGWLVGTVVAILMAAKSLTGSCIKVKYTVPHDSQERTAVVPEDPRFIRPLNHR